MRGDTLCQGARQASDSLGEAVAASLNDSGYAALSYVDCQVYDDCEVVLQGSVPSYHLKQMAQTFARRVAGVGRVVNRLAVSRPADVLRSAP